MNEIHNVQIPKKYDITHVRWNLSRRFSFDFTRAMLMLHNKD